MKKTLAFFLPPIFIATAIFFAFQYFILLPAEKGALQVTASPDSEVFLGGKYIGKTPLCKCPDMNEEGKESTKDLLPAGDYSLRLVPSNKSFPEYTESVTIRKNLLTVVDRKFEKNAGSEGSVISLLPLPNKKASEIIVVTFPDKAEVLIDDRAAGISPLLIKDVAPEKHELRVRKEGYKDKIVPLLSTQGYRIAVTVYLGVDEGAEVKPQTPAASPSATPSGGPKTTLTPTPSKIQSVTILDTPNGFLRVREEASVDSGEVARVNTGETFPVVDQETGWYKIELSDGQEGWISSQYATEE